MFLDIIRSGKTDLFEETGTMLGTARAYASETKKGTEYSIVFCEKRFAILPFPCHTIQKNAIYLLSIAREKPHIKSPTSTFTQVHIKELKDKGCLLGFCLYDLLDTQKAEIIIYASKLCSKYKVPFYVTTFADEPRKMRKESDIRACLRAVGFGEQCSLLATSSLYASLEKSVSFL